MKRQVAIALLLLLIFASACDDLNTRDDPVARTNPEVTEVPTPKHLPSRLQLFVEREQVPVCRRPYGLAAATDEKTIFVACAGSGQVTALDTEFFDRRWTTVPLYERIYKIVVDPQRPRLFAVGMNGSRVHVIETESGARLKSLAMGGAIADLALVPGYDRLVVTVTQPPQAVLIDLKDLHEVGRIRFPTPPGSLAIRADGSLACAGSGVWQRLVRQTKVVKEPVYLFDPRGPAGPVMDIGLGGSQARRPIFLEDGQTLLVPERSSDTVAAYDVQNRRLIRTIQVGGAPEMLTTTPNGRWAFSLDAGGASITRIDLRRKQAAGQVVLPGDPQDMILSPDGTQLMAALSRRDGRAGEIAIVDVESVAVLDRIRVGLDPCDLTTTHSGRKLIVSNFRSDTVSILE